MKKFILLIAIVLTLSMSSLPVSADPNNLAGTGITCGDVDMYYEGNCDFAYLDCLNYYSFYCSSPPNPACYYYAIAYICEPFLYECQWECW